MVGRSRRVGSSRGGSRDDLEILDKGRAGSLGAWTAGGREVGVVTSGCPSPTLGTWIAMAFVDRERTPVGTALGVDTGRGLLEAKVVPLPFYKREK